MKQVALLAFHDALATSISLPNELLNAANSVALQRHRKTIISADIVGLDPSPIEVSGGLNLLASTDINNNKEYDLIIIPSRWRHPHRGSPLRADVQQWLRDHETRGAVICSVGNGSYFLAEAGLLDGRVATTHWHYFDDFATRYPKVSLHRDHLITQTDNIFCSGSVNSAADLVVHLIDRYWGAPIANRVAQQFSPESRRPFSRNSYRVNRSDLHRDETIALAQNWLARNIATPLNIPELAKQSGLSERSFHRRFRQITGLPPLQYVQKLRIELAKDLLQNSNLSVDEIGQQCGYSDSSYFCRLFKQHCSASPGKYRHAVRRKLFEVNKA
ncbi:HTH-type transcriptional regulator CdhR [Zhongshania aliphaticivorans]|uniref:HTH-type transcriptional regulator CdhR n=1 Tax=Zhongshania aliphaticivorans TaxID=1470434 RepID=A0A5S9NAA5_9GAMM|nr:helix-turn-helix domain-containing protein [Zhongshania aliphaticivorans]CAA0087064.1 HTH-type transcriptional regulator CdhR [Zhongshania aliphaticivorans]CAA0114007.1 HTH-type transcriptional regulator CdhR [Zhongshania aliphaticivorans]